MQAERIYELGEIDNILPQYQLFNQCQIAGTYDLGEKIDVFNPVVGVQNGLGETSPKLQKWVG